jgi:hypothetical protein
MPVSEASAFRMELLPRNGVDWTPVVNVETGEFLDLDELLVLAATGATPAPPRRLVSFILFDESTPRPWRPDPSIHPDPHRRAAEFKGIRPHGLKYPCIPRVSFPLLLLDGMPIGAVERVDFLLPGATPGTEGNHVLAVAAFGDTVLADVSWRGVQDGILSAVSARLASCRADDEGFITDAVITGVKLCHADHSCLANTRILAAWEQEARA